MGVPFGDFSPRISWTFSIASACDFPGGTAGQSCSQPASFHQQLYVHVIQSLLVYLWKATEDKMNTIQGTVANMEEAVPLLSDITKGPESEFDIFFSFAHSL